MTSLGFAGLLGAIFCTRPIVTATRAAVQWIDGTDLKRNPPAAIMCPRRQSWTTKTPTVLVDDIEMTWDDLGRALVSYEGFGLRIEICDVGDE